MSTIIVQNSVIFTEALKKDEFGIVRGNAKTARVGIMKYVRNGIKYNELVPEEELKKAVDRFNTILCLDHPQEAVTIDNAYRYQKGSTSNARLKNGWLSNTIVISDGIAVKKAETSHRYFSNSYLCNRVEESGIWVDKYGVMGEVGKEYPYDAVHRDLKPNHMALVRKPRAGQEATFVSNSLDNSNSLEIIINSEDINNQNTKSTMATIAINNEVYEVDESSVAPLKQLIKGKEELIANQQEEIKQLKSEVSQTKGQVAVLNSEIETLKKQPDVTQQAIDDAVNKRLELLSVVSNGLSASEIVGKSDFEIKKSYVVKHNPALKDLVTNSEDVQYIEGMFSAVKAVTPRQGKGSQQFNSLTNNSKDTSQTGTDSKTQMVLNSDADYLNNLQDQIQEKQLFYFFS